MGMIKSEQGECQPVDGLPLYNDLALTRESLERLMKICGVKKMYLAWVDEPYTGKGIKEIITASLEYLDGVDVTTRQVVNELSQNASPEDITREVLTRLGLEPPPVMPMTIQSIMTHVS